jgi:hypothetical protein
VDGGEYATYNRNRLMVECDRLDPPSPLGKGGPERESVQGELLFHLFLFIQSPPSQGSLRLTTSCFRYAVNCELEFGDDEVSGV